MSRYRNAVQLLTELAMQTDKGIVLANALIAPGQQPLVAGRASSGSWKCPSASWLLLAWSKDARGTKGAVKGRSLRLLNTWTRRFQQPSRPPS